MHGAAVAPTVTPRPAIMPHRLPESSLLLLADTCLLWGHRLSEWCGHGPILEEDIALTNTALDLIGQARSLLQIAGRRSSPAVSEDRLAYFRDAAEFHNLVLAELPNGDYAQTMLRSLLLAAWIVPVWQQLSRHPDREVATVAADAVKAARMQLRHAHDWVVRFGDGTDESRRRLVTASEALWPATAELVAAQIDGVDSAIALGEWSAALHEAFAEAKLELPVFPPPAALAATPQRSELLAEMQSLARQHPDAVW